MGRLNKKNWKSNCCGQNVISNGPIKPIQFAPFIPQAKSLPPGAILKTDYDEEKRELVYIGYQLEERGEIIRFVKPIPCRPSK